MGYGGYHVRKLTTWGTVIAAFVVLAIPFVGGGPGVAAPARASVLIPAPERPDTATGSTVLSDTGCPAAIAGKATDDVPDTRSPLGVLGTSQDDLVTFAAAFNAIRVENCLEPIPFSNFTWNSCMEQRLFWMAEDPSTDPASAWGHLGTVRSDGVPSVGCDGNIAGGADNTGATVATKWWESLKHRASLYRPGSDIEGACIAFAMTHGGVPNEDENFIRASARWYAC